MNTASCRRPAARGRDTAAPPPRWRAAPGRSRAWRSRPRRAPRRRSSTRPSLHRADRAPVPIRGGDGPQASSIARAKSSGSNGRRSSSPSPMPISFTGTPSSWAIASAIPPLAVPSSLVSTMPSTSTASRNSIAWRRPFWPVVASIESSVSCGASGRWLRDHLAHLRAARPSGAAGCAGARRCRRSPRRGRGPRPASTASKATAPGSEPGAPRTSRSRRARPTRRAARPPPRGTCRPPPSSTDLPSSCGRCQAILPIVVVLPVPFTPTIRITVGLAASGRSCRSPARARLGQQLAQPAGELLAARQLARARLGLQALHDLRRGGRAHVGVDQRLLQPLQGLVVERSGRPWPAAPRRAPGASWTCSRAGGGRTRRAALRRAPRRRAAAAASRR